MHAGAQAKVVIELLEGDDSLSAVADRYQISPGLLSDRRHQLADDAASVFSMEKDARDHRELAEEHEQEVDDLNRIIGELTVFTPMSILSSAMMQSH